MTNEIISVWRRAICSPDGPAPGTRLVLLAVSLRLERGDRSPSASQLADDTGLVKRSIIAHLHQAEVDGWIVSSSARLKGRLWKKRAYEHRFPARFDGNPREREEQQLHHSTAAIA